MKRRCWVRNNCNEVHVQVQQQRREVVPKCSSHPNQELLFCETCDCVFCSLCTSDGHINTREGDQGASSVDARTSIVADHTVIPFSIAIKRMSEILLYKAKECTTKVGRISCHRPFPLHSCLCLFSARHCL